MRIVDKMYLHPGQCAICRHGESAVDTNKNFQATAGTLRNGRIYICDGCVGTLAKTLGFHTLAQTAKLEADLLEARTQVKELEEKVKLTVDASVLYEKLNDAYGNKTRMRPASAATKN